MSGLAVMGPEGTGRVNRNLKLVRVAALLGAVGSASVFLGFGSAPASAGEQRLHNEFNATYGLVPLFKGSGNDGASRLGSMKATKASMSSGGKPAAGGNKRDEPRREDPELPGFNGDNPDGPTAMSNG